MSTFYVRVLGQYRRRIADKAVKYFAPTCSMSIVADDAKEAVERCVEWFGPEYRFDVAREVYKPVVTVPHGWDYV